MNNYSRLLSDPFFGLIEQPKLLDGKVSRSAGVKLRRTGKLVCSSTSPTWICLFPGYSHTINFFSPSDPGMQSYPGFFTGHVETASNRSFIKQLRVVSAGLRLTLLNNTDEDEGYWEAVRVNVLPEEFSSVNPDVGHVNVLPIMLTDTDLSSFRSYQKGTLNELHDYTFSLNSVNTEHNFQQIEGSTSEMRDQNAFHLDEAFDVVLIKIRGRIESSSPSELMYDSVSNQELIFTENTNVARLMTPTRSVVGFQDMLAASQSDLPGVLTRKLQRSS